MLLIFKIASFIIVIFSSNELQNHTFLSIHQDNLTSSNAKSDGSKSLNNNEREADRFSLNHTYKTIVDNHTGVDMSDSLSFIAYSEKFKKDLLGSLRKSCSELNRFNPDTVSQESNSIDLFSDSLLLNSQQQTTNSLSAEEISLKQPTEILATSNLSRKDLEFVESDKAKTREINNNSKQIFNSKKTKGVNPKPKHMKGGNILKAKSQSIQENFDISHLNPEKIPQQIQSYNKSRTNEAYNFKRIYKKFENKEDEERIEQEESNKKYGNSEVDHQNINYNDGYYTEILLEENYANKTIDVENLKEQVFKEFKIKEEEPLDIEDITELGFDEGIENTKEQCSEKTQSEKELFDVENLMQSEKYVLLDSENYFKSEEDESLDSENLEKNFRRETHIKQPD